MQRRLIFAPTPRHHRRDASVLVVAVVALIAFLVPGLARAQNRANEGPAKALQKKAMEDDYLNTDFDKAADKLNQAIAKCGTDKCGVPLRAQLRRDLAVVHSAAGHKDQALTAMTDAFKIDAGLQLDPNFKTKELDAIYHEAKKAAASGGGGGGPPPAGDFSHTPVTEQQVRTPVPIYTEYGGSETLKRVIAKYKGLGMTEWKSLELKSIGSGYGANVPCADVQAGDFQYYLQGFNDQNDPVASGGDRSNPYHVAIKNDAVADPPHLPGQSPPSQCADKGDCPPDFPGCKKAAPDKAAPVVDESLKGEGEACEEDSECKSTSCKDSKCTAPPEDTSKPKRIKFWVGVAGSLDLTFLHSSNNVCQLYLPGATPGTTLPAGGTAGQPTNSAGYFCTDNGNDYPTRQGLTQAEDLRASSADSVGGGMAPGNVRLMASFDYAATYNMMIGARIGAALITYPGSAAKSFPPLHIEARYTYVFGDQPIGNAGLHPFVLAGLGLADFASSVNVAVFENPCSSPASNSICARNVQAWEIGGPFFIEAGGGARWAFTPAFAAYVDLKLVGALGGGAGFMFIPTPEVGAQYGF